jgi:hypothetical protein
MRRVDRTDTASPGLFAIWLVIGSNLQFVSVQLSSARPRSEWSPTLIGRYETQLDPD